MKRMTAFRVAGIGVLVVTATVAFAQQEISKLVGPPQPMETVPQDVLPAWVVDDVRKMRAYPEQPPVIPHSTEGYQVTLNTNRCLTCHRREFAEASGAPMISITHFMTREGQMLADVSPRRYFCTTCHVRQADVAPIIGNTFVDMLELGARPAGSE